MSAALVVLSVSVGAVPIPPGDVLAVVAHHLLGTTAVPDPITDQIVWDIRLPRALLGVLVGGSLAVAGTALQAMVRNPLADPYVLGVSSGASLAAVAVLLSGVAVGGAPVQIAAFLGALAALLAVSLLAGARGTLPPLRLVLAGVALSYALSGTTSYLIFASDDPQAAQSVLFWLLGSLGPARWESLGVPAAALVLGCGWLLARAPALDAMVLGDEPAATLGFAAGRLRRELLVVSSLVTGVVVAVSGGIGFVGLMIPHLVRLLTGPTHARLLPLATVVGAGYLVAVDVVARTVNAPVEVPLGVVTSVLGAPVFLWLLRSRMRADR
ncbi:iron ABC transporter permease [Pseudonocardia sp. S2-4]|uniref:Iron ABC transporter permease n=2 Tax=Pseudonocardia humida TaxID=2800819 RepID=A0ABT0ZWP5_9PSEU|nr:iron ABC transporter permease [Pseudonocardia humida]